MTDERFMADHAPGSMVPSASGMPTLFVPPERLPKGMPSAFAYACHLADVVPFPELDGAVLRRGKWLEPCGRLAIKDTFGLVVDRPNGDDNSHLRRERAAIPAVCWLDDQIGTDTAVEYKSINETTFKEDWAAGPPEHVAAQVHSQLTIDPNLKRVLVVPIIFGFATIRVEQYEVERDPGICDMIADSTAAFVAMLRRGELPEYDGSEPSYRAWAQQAKIDEAKVLDLSDDREARWRAEDWRQAQLDKAALEATAKAHRYWFSRRIDGAGRIRIDSIDQDIRIKRVEKRAHEVPEKDYLDWRFVKRDER